MNYNPLTNEGTHESLLLYKQERINVGKPKEQ